MLAEIPVYKDYILNIRTLSAFKLQQIIWQQFFFSFLYLSLCVVTVSQIRPMQLSASCNVLFFHFLHHQHHQFSHSCHQEISCACYYNDLDPIFKRYFFVGSPR